MKPGVERAIMQLADQSRVFIKVLQELTKELKRFNDSRDEVKLNKLGGNHDEEA